MPTVETYDVFAIRILVVTGGSAVSSADLVLNCLYDVRYYIQ
jgi:hypothetical protein